MQFDTKAGVSGAGLLKKLKYMTIGKSARKVPYGHMNLQKFAHFHWFIRNLWGIGKPQAVNCQVNNNWLQRHYK
jgi:hypothetical protein